VLGMVAPDSKCDATITGPSPTVRGAAVGPAHNTGEARGRGPLQVPEDKSGHPLVSQPHAIVNATSGSLNHKHLEDVSAVDGGWQFSFVAFALG